MHKLVQIIKEVNRTHKQLGQMIVMNILAAKAKKTILNVSPAGCGKSISSQASANLLQERCKSYTSLTLAGLVHLKKEISNYDGHIMIDDLGAEKSTWSRVSTITTLANLVYTHHVDKITHAGRITIDGFNGSVSLNIQPVLMNSLVQDDEWISVVRDKVLRYYHFYRPTKPQSYSPHVELRWGKPLHEITLSKHKGQLWYQLIAIGLTQWGNSRILEHIPDLLRASASLDGREEVNATDYRLLIKLLLPLQLERYIVDTYGFEAGRVFNNNLYCILVELASFGNPTLLQICEDYKVSPTTAERLIKEVSQWCYIKDDSPQRVLPTEQTSKILDLCGVGQKW